MANPWAVKARHSHTLHPTPMRLRRLFALAALLVILLSNAQCQVDTAALRLDIQPLDAPFAMPRLQRPVFPDRQFNIADFGAQDGGTVKNTRAIQNAIDHAAEEGGGTVIIPRGTWLTGAIHLEDNINLRLENDAVLLFSQDPADYLPAVFSRHEDVECYKYSSFIYARGKKNIAITGEGKLDGQGKPWWDWKQKKLETVLTEMGNQNVPVEQRLFDGSVEGRVLRPAFFQPMECSNILVEGVTFLYGAFWTITPTYCENIIVRNVTIRTEGEYGHTPNGDGVNPSSCKNVLIENCVFDTGDDCIAIKAGRDGDGIRVNKPTENIVVRNCVGLQGHGGIVIGSETSGGVRNIYAVNCDFTGTDRMVRLKTSRGRGGILENMWFKNITGRDLQEEAIHLNMLYTGKRLPAQPVTRATPAMRNIHFENITCESGKKWAIELLGIPEMLIENITFDRITARAAKGVHLADVKGITITNSSFTADNLPLIDILDGRDIRLDAVTSTAPVGQFLRVDGPESRGIHIRKSKLGKPETMISRGEGVPADAVTVEE